MAEHLLNLWETLGSITSTTNTKQNSNQDWGRWRQSQQQGLGGYWLDSGHEAGRKVGSQF